MTTAADPPATLEATIALTRRHHTRLREVYRSAGWPCQDTLEIELLASGMLERITAPSGHETLRVTDAGMRQLAHTLERNKAARSAHENLVERVALEMGRAGRLVWRGLSLRAQVPSAEPESLEWVMACPDVFSIRNTTVETYLEPIVHEIKVSRADLLSDLRKADKGAAYLAMASQCWYVLRRGIAQPDEVPPTFGVMLADAAGLEVARAAPRRAMRLPFAVWMALARADAEPGPEGDVQGLLGAEPPA